MASKPNPTERPSKPRAIARSHHYVPAFYLAGFTLAGDRSGTLWVHDRAQYRSWQTRPQNVGSERDFYRFEADGIEPDSVEKALGQIESKAALVLRRIDEARRLPESEDLGVLLEFVALQATRIPQYREWYEAQAARLMKWRTRFALGVPGFFEGILEEMRSQGRELPVPPTVEAALEWLDDESGYTIEVPREQSIRNMLEMAAGLQPILAQRSWSLAVATGGHDFICSDNPVSLVAIGPDQPQIYGFGTAHTDLTIPLNRRLALVGQYEYEPTVFEADQQFVGLFNHRTHEGAGRFIYSGRESYVITAPRPR